MANLRTVWTFAQVTNEDAKAKVYQSVKNGKSRFGWSSKDEHNLALENNWSEHHSRHLFLLQVRLGDWVVHVNTPVWGRCIAGQIKSGYSFDRGLAVEWGTAFRHYFELDKDTIIEFGRKDPNVLPTVNLNPRQRYHRVHAVDDFLTSIDNLKRGSVNLGDGKGRGEYYLKESTITDLGEITKLIHDMHKSKNLELFLAKVFERLPNVVDVLKNGFGWKSDFGADLIVIMKSSLANLEFENKIVVQIKSFEGVHNDLSAVAQIKTAIEKYEASAGMIITTAESSEELEREIREVADSLSCPIDLIAGEDVARFVLRNANDLVFRM